MRLLRDDRGSVTPLVIAFVGILAGLLGVITDSSAAFLARRSVVAAADGAALYAAGAVDRERLYDGSLTRLPLDRGLAAGRARTYLARTNLAGRYGDVTVGSVRLDEDATSVTVTVRAVVPLPFTGRLSGGRRTWSVAATATAQSPLQ